MGQIKKVGECHSLLRNGTDIRIAILSDTLIAGSWLPKGSIINIKFIVYELLVYIKQDIITTGDGNQ